MGKDGKAKVKAEEVPMMTLSHCELRKKLKAKSKERREKERIAEAEEVSTAKIIKKELKQESVQSEGQNNVQGPNEVPKYTLSIALPGSILDFAQSMVLRTYLAGQIARAAAIFKVSEIVIFDDKRGESEASCKQLQRILNYLECPQYLRKHLFKLEDDLQSIGVAAPLDTPNHLRQNEFLPYREGVVTSKPMKQGQVGSFVNIGLFREVMVDKVLKAGTRVTVKLEEPDPTKVKKFVGTLVPPSEPWTKAGIYWGFTVRRVKSLGAALSGDGNYDVIMGTSDKGSPLEKLKLSKGQKRYLVVFGGVEGLEYAFENDESLTVPDVSDLFHHYLNTCPNQGSRTIRTEEAILISLNGLIPYIVNAVKDD